MVGQFGKLMHRERKADSNVGLALRSGRYRGCARTTGRSQDRKCREISNLQLIAPPANRELFKSRFAKARKMNGQASAARCQARRLHALVGPPPVESPLCVMPDVVSDSMQVDPLSN